MTKNTAGEKPFYEKFYEKTHKRKLNKNAVGKSGERSSPGKQYSRFAAPSEPVNKKPDAKLINRVPMFASSALPADAVAVLNSFDSIVQGVRPMNSKQMFGLKNDIKTLSHELTDDRTSRRTGYMNDTALLSAYTRYFTWWNLVRLTRVFANLSSSSFSLSDSSVCIDMGSGPLTAVIALWLARPELRAKKLTFYCVDISQSALSLGEDLYLSVAARAPAQNTASDTDTMHWNIIRVKGALGTSIKQKADLLLCANMFNELCQNSSMPPEYTAKRDAEALCAYLSDTGSICVIEPGIPKTARFVSLLRGFFLQKKMSVLSPCPHETDCPMNGFHAKMGGTAKWCNFAFTTEDAPAALKKLSADSDLPKERAVLSFVFAAKTVHPVNNTVRLRIASDEIRLPGYRAAFYACSEYGLVLAVNTKNILLSSGDLLEIESFHDLTSCPRDSKTGAIIINI